MKCISFLGDKIALERGLPGLVDGLPDDMDDMDIGERQRKRKDLEEIWRATVDILH